MSRADVFIQAGHEGRTTGTTGAPGPLGNEIDWTPIVANEATRILREAGVTVIRENAFLSGRYDVKVAIFIHFDGSDSPCASGASVGYNDPTDRPAADEWKQLYSRYWPYRWMDDNFTANLRGYYGYRYTNTTDSEFVIELGEISCREQAEWLKPRLKWLGALIAHFLSKRINKGNVPDPGPFNALPLRSSTWTDFYAGIDYQDYAIPRRGQINPTLERALGIRTEPLGEVAEFLDRKFVQGKVSWFGGPNDGGVAADETGALTGEILRQLSSDDYYCAMRWNYRGNKSFWTNRHLLVVNSDNGKAVIVRAIDWGPNTSTGRILDLSPKTLDYLSVETDDFLMCAFANTDNNTRKVGPVV
jgi:hypothetical protein